MEKRGFKKSDEVQRKYFARLHFRVEMEFARNLGTVRSLPRLLPAHTGFVGLRGFLNSTFSAIPLKKLLLSS